MINFVLLNLLGLAEPLLWLYPALIAGAGLRVRAAAVGVGLTALAAAAPIALEGRLIHPVDAVQPTDALGPSHSILLSIVLAGLGMTAVRQLIALNAELHATRAELADLAVAGERERLARAARSARPDAIAHRRQGRAGEPAEREGRPVRRRRARGRTTACAAGGTRRPRGGRRGPRPEYRR